MSTFFLWLLFPLLHDRVRRVETVYLARFLRVAHAPDLFRRSSYVSVLFRGTDLFCGRASAGLLYSC